MATTQTPGIHNSLSMRLLRVPVSMEPRRRIRQEQAPTIGRQSLRRAFTASTVNGNNARVDANLLSGLRSAKKERTRGRLAGLFDAEAGAPPSNQDRMNTDLRVREQQQEQRARPVALMSPDDPTLLSTTRTPARVEYDWWAWVAQLLTVCCSRSIISRWHPSHSEQQVQAWREKVASCIIIATLMTIMAFFTIGLQFAFCPSTASLIANSVLDQANHRALAYHSSIVIFGYTYDFNQTVPLLAKSGITVTTDYMSADLTQLFQADACTSYGVNLPCSAKARFGGSSLTAAPCLDPSILSSISPTGRAYFSWDDISVNNDAPNSLTVFNGAVLNLTTYRAVSPPPLFAEYPLVGSIVASNLGLDSTRAFAASYSTLSAGNCLAQRYIVGFVDRASVGCSATQFIQGAILVVIVFLMLIRFLMAFVFYWCMSGRIVFDRQNRNLQLMYKRRTQQSKLLASGPFATADGIGRQPTTGVNQTLSADDSFGANLHSALASNARRNVVLADDPYVVILVTCYTESRDSIQKTVESLARTDYPDSRKLLFVVCDGIVTGKGEDRPTPEYVLSLLTKDDDGEAVPVRQKYVAIADGDRTFNMATVHAGYYEHSGGGKVPMVVVVKCGSLDEANSQSKAGNRGKRDSQLVLMNLLASVFYENARMTPLDFELATKIQEINGGVNPSAYTLVLMVDADTAVYEHALYYMVQAMKNDERIMGLCGETRIENKSQNWVTKIQVFEYYISHQLGKAFESVFGGVTCLPGCFSMYRIKGAPLRNSRDPVSTGDANKMVPLLIDEEVMTYYKEHVLDTLHKQNLLALGEDRYLTTLMLSRCPKRRTIFVPQSMCETTVPDLFKDLLDQRRRWINSTIHNLLELLMVDNLCGVFCLSMRFVVLMELVGTVVLPVAVTLMFVLIITAFVLGASLPLFMLLATLLFPAILILMTTFELEYVGWMFIYLLALPIWNFVLPLNAFWQFDNFKWGQTRQVEGEPHGGTDHGARSGEFEAGSVPTKTWAQWRASVLYVEGNSDPIDESFSQSVAMMPRETVEEIMRDHRSSSDSSRGASSRVSNILDSSDTSKSFHTGRGNASVSAGGSQRNNDRPSLASQSGPQDLANHTGEMLFESKEYFDQFIQNQPAPQHGAAQFQNTMIEYQANATAQPYYQTSYYPGYYVEPMGVYDASITASQYHSQSAAAQSYAPQQHFEHQHQEQQHLEQYYPSNPAPSLAGSHRSTSIVSRKSTTQRHPSPVREPDSFLVSDAYHTSINPTSSISSTSQKRNSAIDSIVAKHVPSIASIRRSERTNVSSHNAIEDRQQEETSEVASASASGLTELQATHNAPAAAEESPEAVYGGELHVEQDPNMSTSFQVQNFFKFGSVTSKSKVNQRNSSWNLFGNGAAENSAQLPPPISKGPETATNFALPQPQNSRLTPDGTRLSKHGGVAHVEYNILDPVRMLDEVSTRMKGNSPPGRLEVLTSDQESEGSTPKARVQTRTGSLQSGSSQHLVSEQCHPSSAGQNKLLQPSGSASSLAKVERNAANVFELSQNRSSSFFADSRRANSVRESSAFVSRRTRLDDSVLDEMSGIDPFSMDFDESFIVVDPDLPRRRNRELMDRSFSHNFGASSQQVNWNPHIQSHSRRSLDNHDSWKCGDAPRSIQTAQNANAGSLRYSGSADHPVRPLPSVPVLDNVGKRVTEPSSSQLQSSNDSIATRRSASRLKGPRNVNPPATADYYQSMTPTAARMFADELKNAKGIAAGARKSIHQDIPKFKEI